MEHWNEIVSEADINYLLDQYGGFHDSCLVKLFYNSGSHVDENCYMVYGSRESHALHMIFNSQWHKQAIELCFTGVRRCSFVGFQDNYFCEILDCYLALHTDLIKGRDDPLIVWADSCEFSPYEIPQESLLHEPDTTYVIAHSLKWRFITDSDDE